MPTLNASRNGAAAATALYDGGCELLFASQQIQAAASQPASTPAIAATLGCIDASLGALLDAIGAMNRSALNELRHTGDGESVAIVERELRALADALAAAQRACDQTRERTGPPLARLTLA